MSAVLKFRPEPSASRTSQLRQARADCPAKQLNGVRGAHVTADPGNPSPTAESADARVDLFTVLYAQLRQIAQSALRRSGPVLTVSPTTLLHEAYLRMSGREGPQFADRGRFMAYASRAMRNLVIDFVRDRQALKRGGAFEITSIPTEAEEFAVDEPELKRISDALDELATVDAALAELVDLKFFCGFSFAEIAAMRACSERSVQRDWNKARLYLHDVLREL
jgi:RNA polymerase sigma factor (TIGR02999 family)